MIWKTNINKMMGTKYPLIMAAFAGYGKTEFAALFSNAGGLGVITALNYQTGDFGSELQKMRELTDKPFGVNLTVLPPGVRALNVKVSKDDYLKYLDIAINEGVKAFFTSAYQATHLGKRIHEADCYWIHKCALIRHAISAERAGADAITLIGMEASGFKNPYQHTTLVNITIAKRLLKVPIIAAGGIGDARGFLGALAMGADGVCLGSAILTTAESPVPKEMKKKWLDMDVLSEDYHRKLYHRELKATRVLSTAIVHQKEIVPLRDFIENIMDEAGEILKSWGFKENQLNISSN
ncbi:MAG: nitronate monooxygenase [Promethearchaeota archaeon Loki_b31]|nr:MAG: nitronate monooxygenase [Candidatus Lokiarchaeota archaeon Loki_b31]